MLIPLSFPATSSNQTKPHSNPFSSPSLMSHPPNHTCPAVTKHNTTQFPFLSISNSCCQLSTLNCRFFGRMPSAQSHSVSEWWALQAWLSVCPLTRQFISYIGSVSQAPAPHGLFVYMRSIITWSIISRLLISKWHVPRASRDTLYLSVPSTCSSSRYHEMDGSGETLTAMWIWQCDERIALAIGHWASRSAWREYGSGMRGLH